LLQQTLGVDIGDTRFAASAVSGSVFNNMQAVAYGVAANCVSSLPVPSSWKTSVVDLRGTPFALSDNQIFTLNGAGPSGNVTFEQNRQIVTVRGGGFCGTMHPGPGPTNLGNYCNLQWLMQLKIANASTAGLPPVLPDCVIPMPNRPFVGSNSCCNSTCALQRDSALPNVTCTTPAPTPLPTPLPTPAPTPAPTPTPTGCFIAAASAVPARSVPYSSNTTSIESCAGQPDGVAKVMVRGGFVVDMLCSGEREYLVLQNVNSTGNFMVHAGLTTWFCAIRVDPVRRSHSIF
jgi:hypothetical protein